VIRETENDDLTAVMQELIETYADDIADVAVQLCASLVGKLIGVTTIT
jgi:predicted Rdx family selenoprotein